MTDRVPPDTGTRVLHTWIAVLQPLEAWKTQYPLVKKVVREFSCGTWGFLHKAFLGKGGGG